MNYSHLQIFPCKTHTITWNAVYRIPNTCKRSGPEDFGNLQGLLVQSSNWFGISSVQFFSSKVQTGMASVHYSSVVCPECSFSSVRGIGAKCLRSVCSIRFSQFSSRILPALLAVVRLSEKQRMSTSIWNLGLQYCISLLTRWWSLTSSASNLHFACFFKHYKNAVWPFV